MKKRFFVIFIAVATSLVILAGCGDSSDDSKKNSDVTNDFSAQAMTYLEKIGKEFTNRNAVPVGETVGKENTHAATVEFIISELKKAGYKDDQISIAEFEAQDKKGNNYKGKNIILSVEGKNKSKQVLAGAHYDGDGCGDNGSGVALLLANAVGLQGKTPAQNVKYIFFDCEEIGLLGATKYAQSMPKEEVEMTEYMINVDSVAFGDYCNIYGGVQDDDNKVVKQTEAYDLAMKKAAKLGMKTYGTKELNGYYKEHKKGPKIEKFALYTNPWTYENPAPENGGYASPATGDWGDHASFTPIGIKYIYMEATNWYAKGDGGEDAFTGYFETDDSSLGHDGMFMNTDADTWENLEKYFPGRAKEHFQVFSPLLSSLVMNASDENAE